MLGLNGLVVKVHGSSTAKEVSTALNQCITFKEQKIAEQIKASFAKKQEVFMEFEKLQQVIADVLDIDKTQITPETTFVQDLGADSLDIMEIIMRLEDEFGVHVPDETIESIVTVKDAEEVIKKLK